MFKHLKYASACALAALALTSCSSDIDEPAQVNNGEVRFTVQLPGNFQTRNAYGDHQYGDGTKAVNLKYAVYALNDEGKTDGAPIITETVNEAFSTGASYNVTLQLAKGKKYEVFCWAESAQATKDAYYTVTWNENGKTVTVDYDKVKGATQEDCDAFYGKTTIDAGATGTVDLKRPFAQINLGTDDRENPSVKKAYESGVYTGLTVKVPNVLDMTDGTATGDAQVAFAAAAEPDKAYNFPVEKTPAYAYINMVYALTDAQGSTYDLAYDFYNGQPAAGATADDAVTSRAVTAVPVKANYRTNIFGSLFTSPANLTVTIDPAFGDEDENYDVNLPNAEDLLGYYTWTYTKGYNLTNDHTPESSAVSIYAYDKAKNEFSVNLGGYEVKASFNRKTSEISFVADQQIFSNDQELRLRHFTASEPFQSGNTKDLRRKSMDSIVGVYDGKTIKFSENTWIMLGLLDDYVNSTLNYYIYGGNNVMTKTTAPTPEQIAGTYDWTYSCMIGEAKQPASWRLADYNATSKLFHVYVTLKGSEYSTDALVAKYDEKTGMLAIENAAPLSKTDNAGLIQHFRVFGQYIQDDIHFIPTGTQLLFNSQEAIALIAYGAWLEVGTGNQFVKQ